MAVSPALRRLGMMTPWAPAEMRTHKRVIDILYPTAKTAEALMKVELPAGVEAEMKIDE